MARRKMYETFSNVYLEYNITTSSQDLTPEGIVNMIDTGIINMPVFQRSFVWDIKKASKFIESLILGIPIPDLFFFADENENGIYRVIDGQQRILSIYFFFKGKFPKNNTARLDIPKHLPTTNFDSVIKNSKNYKDFRLELPDNFILKNKTFSELMESCRTKLRLQRFLHTVVIKQNKEDTNKQVIFEIFNRLNTGGSALTHQEIRASLYYCSFYEMIAELNGNPEWRRLLNKPVKNLHGEDIELILRAFAMLIDGDSYAPMMPAFLNSFSSKAKSFSDDRIAYLKALFLSFVESCSKLSDKAFFREQRFSKALFEAIFVAVCAIPLAEEKLIEGKISSASVIALKDDEDFISYLQSGSGSVKNTKNRLKRASELIIVE